MKIVLASNNPGKIRELQALLPGITIIPQRDLGVEEIEETGLTFIENAILKARHATQKTGLPALADDSGLEVAALKGAPGIYSARYAGKDATPQKNIQKLLTELKDFSGIKRKANYYCVLAFLTHAEDPTPIICEGSWHGFIALDLMGENGFGYDPIFFDPKENCSAAQLSPLRKNQISHRAQALRLLVEKLKG